MRIRPLRLLRIICFRNFSQHAHAPPLKTPLAPSPACFNHSIIFESLLLESIRPHPSLRTPPQDSLPTLGLAMTALPGLASAALSGRGGRGEEFLQPVGGAEPRLSPPRRHTQRKILFRVLDEVRKPAFRHGIPGCCGDLEKAAHGNLRYLPRA